ncbi:MAG: tail-specific protease [Sphingobacteriales bacterium]|nr:MAG: tail-specific protease [Sphingobacteriales bacterium]
MKSVRKRTQITWLSFAALLLVFSSYRDDTKEQTIAAVMMAGLQQIHYQPQKIDDAYSQKVFDLTLKRVDQGKRFFLKEDIAALNEYRTKIDDELEQGNFNFFNKMLGILTKRIDESEAYYKVILDKPFDFTKEEEVELDGAKLEYAANTDALHEQWRKYLKYQVMLQIATQTELQANNKAADAKTKSPAELEADARKKVAQNQAEYFKFLKGRERTDWMAYYYNAMANVFDPHTEYFPPKEKEEFDISMTGQLEGIGAQLQEKDGMIKVANIVPGSASYKQGQLKAGDIIIKVGQGREEPVDVTNMRLDKVVTQVRGKKGTEVRLTVKKPDGSITVIPIVRDIVVLEETYAQGAMIKAQNTDKNVGYIKLPGFYTAMERGGRTSWEDVKNEVLKLKKDGAQGIILDLRNNGGGSLGDVVKMGGLFIDKGPIVQVKSKGGDIRMLNDEDPDVVYDGPLVIMVNPLSASASEIMAAAMQDYGRAVILGSTQTFGKGSVQQFFDLDDYLNGEYASLKPMGSVKISLQKFYRINGESTQIKGVASDVVLPDIYSYMDLSEADQDYPMPWDKISSAKYTKWKKTIPESVLKNSRQRVAKSNDFKLVEEQALDLKKNIKDTKSTLNLEKFIAQQKIEKEENKRFESVGKSLPALTFNILKDDAARIGSDTTKLAREKTWQKPLLQDAYLHEAVNIISEMK